MNNEPNDREWRGYVRAKLESISENQAETNASIKEIWFQGNQNAKDISRINTSDKIQMTFILAIILGLISLFMKTIFG